MLQMRSSIILEDGFITRAGDVKSHVVLSAGTHSIGGELISVSTQVGRSLALREACRRGRGLLVSGCPLPGRV